MRTLITIGSRVADAPFARRSAVAVNNDRRGVDRAMMLICKCTKQRKRDGNDSQDGFEVAKVKGFVNSIFGIRNRR